MVKEERAMANVKMFKWMVLLFQLFVVTVNCSENVNNSSILETVRQLEQKINGRLEVCEKETNHLHDSLAAQYRITTELKASMKHQEEVLSSLQHSITKRHVEPGQMVAFTVYVDHNTDHLGINQVIPFNSVVTNIGGGFNTHTHTFTCPISGLFFFAFMISDVGNRQLVVKLVVDGINVVDAIANPVQTNHDQQGGNMAVIQLNKGQSVHLLSYNDNDAFLRTDQNFRLATFSGFLLQANDPAEVVG